MFGPKLWSVISVIVVSSSLLPLSPVLVLPLFCMLCKSCLTCRISDTVTCCIDESFCCFTGGVGAARSSGGESGGALGARGGRRAAGGAETQWGAPAVHWPPAAEAAGLCSERRRGALAERPAGPAAGAAQESTGRGETAEGTGQILDSSGLQRHQWFLIYLFLTFLLILAFCWWITG